MTAVEPGRLELSCVEFKDGGREFTAVVSTSAVDRQGDIVLPTAFTPGQRVPLLVGHTWTELPVGSGVISTTQGDARIAAEFFDTSAGKEAAATIKGLGPLAQFSIGFEPQEYDFQDLAGRRVRVIRKLHLHEVSIVVVGASLGTGLVRSFHQEELADRKAIHEADCQLCRMRQRHELLMARYATV